MYTILNYNIPGKSALSNDATLSFFLKHIIEHNHVMVVLNLLCTQGKCLTKLIDLDN